MSEVDPALAVVRGSGRIEPRGKCPWTDRRPGRLRRAPLRTCRVRHVMDGSSGLDAGAPGTWVAGGRRLTAATRFRSCRILRLVAAPAP